MTFAVSRCSVAAVIMSVCLNAFALHFARSGGGGGAQTGGDNGLEFSVETRTLTLRLKWCRLSMAPRTGCSCRKSGLMKHKAPWPAPKSNSDGLLVCIGQNSWNRLGPVLVHDSCDLGFRGGCASVTDDGPFRGPRKFNWELQNSGKNVQ